MVQHRTNFCSQQINASFWCNIGQKFLECSTCTLAMKPENIMQKLASSGLLINVLKRRCKISLQRKKDFSSENILCFRNVVY